jgi:lipopolysaccharide export system permease protein
MSMFGAILGVGAVRLLGFVSIVFGANTPWLLSLQYIAIFAAFAGGFFVIRSGLILEPPAFLTNAINAVTERLSQRFAPQQ